VLVELLIQVQDGGRVTLVVCVESIGFGYIISLGGVTDRVSAALGLLLFLPSVVWEFTF